MMEEMLHRRNYLPSMQALKPHEPEEAGKGFVVVATEISKMATQTGDATGNITKLIENISTAIEEVVTVIYEMIDGINAEKSSTESTAKSFDNIQNNTYAIRDNVEQLTQSIVELKNANNVIVDSIQTISAVSEQLSAHASGTTNNEEENVKILESIADKMHGLIDTVKEDDSASL
jgi:Methyl-accepting chemotaxis protein